MLDICFDVLMFSYRIDVDREKVEDFLQFLTHAGEMRYPICGSRTISGPRLMFTLTLKIVSYSGSDETMPNVLA